MCNTSPIEVPSGKVSLTKKIINTLNYSDFYKHKVPSFCHSDMEFLKNGEKKEEIETYDPCQCEY